MPLNALRSDPVAELSNFFNELRIPASDDFYQAWLSQNKKHQWHPLPVHPGAAGILSRISIPRTITAKKRMKAFVRSTTISPRGKAYLPQCSQILPGRFWIADYFSGTDLPTLQQLGITHVISIGDDRFHEAYPRFSSIVHESFTPPADIYNKSLVSLFEDALAMIDKTLRADVKHRVLVHCSLGVNWSPGIAIAWVMNNTGCTFEDAYSRVIARREVTQLHAMVKTGIHHWWHLQEARPRFPEGRGRGSFRWAKDSAGRRSEGHRAR